MIVHNVWLTVNASMTNLTTKEIALLGVAAIAAVMAFGLINEANIAKAQEANITTTDTAAVVVADKSALDLLMDNVNTTILAASGLFSTIAAIVTYVASAIKNRTGNRILSDDMYNKTIDVVGQLKRKDGEILDFYRQFLEQRQTINTVFNMLKGANPEIAKKIDEALPIVNEKVQNEVLPHINELREQANTVYESLMKKQAVRV